jgi:lysophospholipase L1-like esterase
VKRAAIVALASVLLPACRSGGPRVRVACIGDSITAGTGIDDPARRYPAILGALLGERYEVRAFGSPGATMLSSGDTPYVSQRAFQEALAFRPDVNVVALGTNDTKPWKRFAPSCAAHRPWAEKEPSGSPATSCGRGWHHSSSRWGGRQGPGSSTPAGGKARSHSRRRPSRS